MSSLMIDGVFLYTMMIFLLEADTARLIYCVGVFYGMRALLQVYSSDQGMFLFKIPLGSYWPSPGIPSLMVPYGIMSDFYFSGHTGYMILIMLERWIIDRNRFFAVCCGVFTFYIIVILLIFRVHYSIGTLRSRDIPIGVMWGFVSYYTVLPISKKLDRLITKYLIRGLLCGFASLFIGRKVRRCKKKQSMDSQTFDTPATIDTPMLRGSSDEGI